MSFKAFAAAAALAVWAVAAPNAQAQDARPALARELMQLMELEGELREFFAVMAPVVAEGMGNELQLSQVETARLGEIVAEEFAAATPGLISQLADVYAAQMNEAQLRETLVFMRSDAGAAFLQTKVNAEAELERIGRSAGMAVGLQALLRFQQERDQR